MSKVNVDCIEVQTAFFIIALDVEPKKALDLGV